MTLRRITAPIAQPVTLAEAKSHLRAGDDEDALITALIVTATEAAEQATGRALMTQTWEAGFDAFGDALILTRSPVVSITSVTYIDSVGATQTLSASSYRLIADDFGTARVILAYGAEWPALRGDEDGVKVRYVAGYASAGLVPEPIKSWIYLQIGAMYENREAETIGAGSAISLGFADRLLDRYRVYAV
jgi:uncharacterized phiE125 gp8 family phage protein